MEKTTIIQELTTREAVQILTGAVHIIQEKVIGMFRLPGSDSDDLVIEDDEHTFVTVHVGGLLGVQTTHLPKSRFQFTRFPDGKNLKQMMEDPFYFDEWYKHLWS